MSRSLCDLCSFYLLFTWILILGFLVLHMYYNVFLVDMQRNLVISSAFKFCGHTDFFRLHYDQWDAYFYTLECVVYLGLCHFPVVVVDHPH